MSGYTTREKISELLNRFEKEIRELESSGAGVPLTLTPTQAMMLLSLLQLALRHPGCREGHCAAFGRELAENLEARLGNGRPAIAEVARRGWLEQYDAIA